MDHVTLMMLKTLAVFIIRYVYQNRKKVLNNLIFNCID